MLFIAMLIALLCLGAIYEAFSARSDPDRHPPPGQLVDVGGIRLHLNCTGSGSPVVVLESGLGDSSLVWSEVQSRLSRSHRVCSYDRAGIAWSDPGKGPWDGQIAVDQIRALLRAAGENPPYVLVGHSAGANYARLFAITYPSDVQALLVVEPPLLSEVPPVYVVFLQALRAAIGGASRVGGIRLLGRLRLMKILFAGASPPEAISDAAGFLYNHRSIAASIREVGALPATITRVNELSTPGALQDIPFFVVAAQSGTEQPARLAQALQELAKLSSRGRVISVASSHFVHFDTPETLVNYIKEAAEDTQ